MTIPTPTDGGAPTWRPDRRSFLLAATAAVAAACSASGDGDGGSAGTDSPSPSAPPTTDGVGDATTTADTTAAVDEVATTVAAGDEVAALTPAAFDAVGTCMLTAAQTEGPFPNIARLDRRDITDGVPGHPLRLGIRVLDETCTAIPGATVEIWHADATGDYSEYVDGGSGKDEGEGTTFCRGVQVADDDGIVEFQTVYPGWYSGRAVHIHAKVLIDDQPVLVTQLYFDEEYTASVHTQGVYAEFGLPDTSWQQDGIAGSPTTDGTAVTSAAAPTPNGAGTLGLINIGLDPDDPAVGGGRRP